MQNFQLVQFSNDQELADAVARRWLAELLGRPGARYCVALSGGRIAARLFSTLSALAAGKVGQFAAVHWFWGDERCVPPDNPESNFGLAQKLLLGPLSIPPAQVHRVRGEEQPALAAQLAERELRGLASSNSAGQPVFDLIFLGMGEDGHVASLFPEEEESRIEDPAVYRHVVGSKPPPDRITLGYRAIAAARRVWVLASGAGKERALSESIAPGGRTPLGRVLRLRRETVIFTDMSATSL